MLRGHHHRFLFSSHPCSREKPDIFSTSPVKVVASELCSCIHYLGVFEDMFISFLSGFPCFSTQRGAVVLAVLLRSAPFYMLPRWSKQQQQKPRFSYCLNVHKDHSGTLSFLSPHGFLFSIASRGGRFCPDLSQQHSQAYEEVAQAVSLLCCSRWLSAVDCPSRWTRDL